MPDLALALGLAVLLVLTSGWCAMIYHRLRRLRADRGEMVGFIEALDAAVGRAEQVLAGLRAASVEADGQLRAHEAAARQRGADLARLMEGGARLAKRLESAMQGGARAMAEHGMTARPPATGAPVGKTPEPAGGSSGGGLGLSPAVLRSLEALR